ncbi:unnamed protein product [Nesidiocoris tenuis]|uniref:Uncharacterized protein n=1 Tax=Nesidiocoris tenuis TaxID=355587 RepID=A0A6H5G1K3_9HEMI|nr:unnamed protein product [Nesidiocoris tenuis]
MRESSAFKGKFFLPKVLRYKFYSYLPKLYGDVISTVKLQVLYHTTEERWRRRISAPADRYPSQLLICYPTENISNDSHDSANSKRSPHPVLDRLTGTGDSQIHGDYNIRPSWPLF